MKKDTSLKNLVKNLKKKELSYIWSQIYSGKVLGKVENTQESF